ncbi:MAG: TetR/AcrR family transcriptional regulator [Nocardiaceae bacterium]|nr:TetR/AcrR family transcriptional regulator [Nocardiaceae bacterium]
MTGINRRQLKKDELKRDIIDAAFEAFAKAGYHNTGIADIAETLGIGHGTFYRYFQNKRDIIDHVVADLASRIAVAMSEENDPTGARTLDEYRHQVARIGESLVSILSEDPRIPRVLLFEAMTVDDALRSRVSEMLDAMASMTAAYLHHGVGLGYLRADLDVEFTAKAINGAMIALVLQDMQSADAAIRTRFSEAIQRLMYDGIAARPGA